MEDTKLTLEKIKGLEYKFSEFLRGVSLRLDTEPTPGPDGLIHFELQFMGDGSVRLEHPTSMGDYYSKEKNKFYHLYWDDEVIDDAVDEAQKLCPGISKKQIRRALRKLMVQMFNSQLEKVNGELENIFDILDTSNMRQELFEAIQKLKELAGPQIVFVPIEGVDLRGRNLAIGSVVLHSRGQGDESELDHILQKLEEQEGGKSVSYIREKLTNCMCYATLEIIGDGTFVRERAIQQVTEVIHILNLFLSSSAHQPSWAKISVSEVVFNQWVAIESSIPQLHQAYPSNRPLELTMDKLLDVIGSVYDPPFSSKRAWENDYKKRKQEVNQDFERLALCFRENDDISKRIRRGVTWYSKAVDADTLEEQFVNLSIALESLLIGDEGKGPYATTGSISQNLGERTAFLLEDDFESRQQRVRDTKNLYGLRSAIVHRGEQITQEQLMKMDNLVKQVILTFLKHEFKSWSDFQEWIARQKFDKKFTGQDTNVEDPA